MSDKIILMDFSDTLSEEMLPQALEQRHPVIVDCRDIEGCGRFCDPDAAAQIRQRISDLPCEGLHWIDSGDYHFATLFWCEKMEEPFDLLLFDHHTDMQPPRFEGLLSCGSWVLEMLGGGGSPANPMLRHVYMIGVSESLRCETEDFPQRVFMLSEEELSQMSAAEMVSWLEDCGADTSLPLYISIDKDALSPADATTNWDQGSLRLDTLCEMLTMLRGSHRIIGADICGGAPLNSIADLAANCCSLRPVPASELNLRADLALIRSLL